MSAYESAQAILDAFDRNLADALSAIRDAAVYSRPSASPAPPGTRRRTDHDAVAQETNSDEAASHELRTL